MKPATRIEMKRSEALAETLRRAIAAFRPGCVIETGTHIGKGSTRAIVDAFRSTPVAGGSPPEHFFTIEVSREFVRRARVNLSDVPQVECVWGMTVRAAEARAFLERDYLLRTLDPGLDIYVDFLPDPRAGYLRELEGALGEDQAGLQPPDGMLDYLLRCYRGHRPLICLDSAGGIGWLEFQEVLRVQAEFPYLLMLDDTNHIKHFRSAEQVRRSDRFIIFGDQPDEGWMVAATRETGA